MKPKKPIRPAVMAHGSLAELAARYLLYTKSPASLKEIVEHYKKFEGKTISPKMLVTAIVQYISNGRAFVRVSRGVYDLTEDQRNFLLSYAPKK